MGLNNSQYNQVMREYEQQQLENRYEQQRRVMEVYERVPQIRALDEEIRTQGAKSARMALKGDENAGERFRENLADLREQKQVLLAAAGYPPDYMDMQYRCPVCKDTGYEGGKRCRCFEQARTRILYAQSNIQQILEQENFQTLSYKWYDGEQKLKRLGMTELDYMKILVGKCKEFAAGFPQNGRNLLFTGSTGVGKTFLTNCIAKELIDRYLSVIYLTSQDLFELLSRYKFGRDFQEEVNNTFVSSQLFYCINERILRQKGTIISTNLSVGALQDMYSDRVTSRIMSNYAVIPLYGGDIRMKKKNFRGLT